MGMYQYLRSVTDKEFEAICACPREEVSALLWNDDDFIGNYLELDKTWDGLRFLLTGKNMMTDVPAPIKSSLDWATLGNHSIGGDENPIPCSWIGIRYLSPEEVCNVAEALSKISCEELTANYLPQIMDEKSVYPSDPELNMWQRNGDDASEWLLQYYPGVVGFYQKAASEGKIVLMYMPF
jgi:hypothetical protein